MATRAKALKQFAKNILNHDLTGMSETAVLKDLLKKEFNIDAVGNSVVSVLMNAATDDGGCDEPGYSGVDLDGYTPAYATVRTDTETGSSIFTITFEKEGAEDITTVAEGAVAIFEMDSAFSYVKDCEKLDIPVLACMMDTEDPDVWTLTVVDPVSEDYLNPIATYPVEVRA